MKPRRSNNGETYINKVDFTNVSKTLFIFLRSIGDVLLSTPCIREFKKFLPQSELDVIIDDYCKDILEHNPWIDNILKLKRPPKFLSEKKRFSPDNLKIMKKVITSGYDLVINFHGGPRSFFLTQFSRAKYRVGFKVYYGAPFYNIRLPSPHYILNRKDKIHQVHRKLSLLWGIGVPINSDELEMPLDDESKEHVKNLLKAKGVETSDRMICVNIGATRNTKLWAWEKFADLCETLSSKLGFTVVLTGSDAEREWERRILSKTQKPISLVNSLNLKDLAALYSMSELYIGCDTGPTHIAAAMKTPIVVLFGSSDHNIWWPYKVPHKLVRKNLDCSPCEGCTKERYYCIEDIEVEEVLDAVSNLIQR